MWIGIVTHIGAAVSTGMASSRVKVGLGWAGIGCEPTGRCDRFREKVQHSHVTTGNAAFELY